MRHPVCHLETDAEYSRRLDAELIDDMRRRAAFQERRQRIAEACQNEDAQVLDALETLGYDPTTVTLLYLVPLIQVAWIDGSVNPAERRCIESIAHQWYIDEKAAAYPQLRAWLDRKPSEEFFEGTLQAIRCILESRPENQSITTRALLIRRCRDVANASCGIFGWKSRICLVKRRLIRHIVSRLEPAKAPAGNVGP